MTTDDIAQRIGDLIVAAKRKAAEPQVSAEAIINAYRKARGEITAPETQLAELRSIVLKHRPRLAPDRGGKFGDQHQVEFDRGHSGRFPVARDRWSSRRD